MNGSVPTPTRLGQSALNVGRIAYGCWRFSNKDRAAARKNIETAVSLGMTLIDTADVYGRAPTGEVGLAEEILGSVLAEAADLRSVITVATKGGIIPGLRYDSGSPYLERACEASLRRLGVDTIDLYQVHRPDVLTHPEETAKAFVNLRNAGKVKEVGVSNYSATQFSALQHYLPFKIATVQMELNLLNLEPLWDGVLDQSMESGVTPLAWSPLAGGRLVCSPEDVTVPPPLARTIRVIADRQGVTPATICIAFLLALSPGIVPIVGTQRPSRIRDLAAATSIRLSHEDCYEVMSAAGCGFP